MSGVRRQPRDRRRSWRRAACCSTSRARRCATSTRTAGAARTRSSSAPPSSGSRAWATPTTRRRCAHARCAEIERTQWIPAWGQNRIRGMIEARPDWCLSRQRVWGVPIPAFRCTTCGKDLLDGKVIEHVADIFAREGSNAWFSRPAAELLPAPRPTCACGGRQFEKQQRHRRRLVRVGRVVGGRGGGQAGAGGREGRPLPGGGGPAPRLVPLVAADGDGDARPGALQGGADARLGARRARQGRTRSRRSRRRAPAGAKIDYVDPAVWMEKNGAELLRLWTAAADYQGDVVFSEDDPRPSWASRTGRSATPAATCCRTSTTSCRRATGWRITSCASWICWRWACCASATTRSSTATSATPSTRSCG